MSDNQTPAWIRTLNDSPVMLSQITDVIIYAARAFELEFEFVGEDGGLVARVCLDENQDVCLTFRPADGFTHCFVDDTSYTAISCDIVGSTLDAYYKTHPSAEPVIRLVAQLLQATPEWAGDDRTTLEFSPE